MNKNAFLAVTALVVVGSLVFIFISKGSKQNLPEKSNYSEVVRKDKEIIKQLLNGEKVKDLDAYAALIRESKQNNEDAYKLGLKFVDSENKLFRQAVAQMMANYDSEESLEALKTLSGDIDPSVRQFAFRSLGQLKSEEATSHLKNNYNNLTGDDLVTATSSLYLNSDDESEKLNLLKKLKSEYEKQESHSILAGLTLIRLAPKSEYANAFMQNVINDKTNSRVTVAALRTLSSQKDPWIMDQYEIISTWANSEVARAIVQSMHRSCPSNRWKIITDLVTPTSEPSLVRAAIREMTQLPGPQANDFLERIESTHGDHPQVKSMLAKTMEKIKSSRLRNPCTQ